MSRASSERQGRGLTPLRRRSSAPLLVQQGHGNPLPRGRLRQHHSRLLASASASVCWISCVSLRVPYKYKAENRGRRMNINKRVLCARARVAYAALSFSALSSRKASARPSVGTSLILVSVRMRSSPQAMRRSICGSFGSEPWDWLAKMAALSSPAVLSFCPWERSVAMCVGASRAPAPVPGRSKARRAIVFSSSGSSSGYSSPRGASSSEAKRNASETWPVRMSSMRRCCWR